MAKIYGTPIMAGGAGGANKYLPPLLDNFKAFKGGGTSENPHITIQADKMEESRAKELAGAVWVYGDHIPKNVNDGTKIQLTREEVVTSDGGEAQTVTKTVEWNNEANFFARQFTYNSKKQYQTMLEGAVVGTGDMFNKIYGIKRDITNSSPEWARTDDAVRKTATASVGTTAGASDFDNCYPWSDITRETLSTGDVMVKIPKFWFQRYREGDIEHIRIADKNTAGFTLHPAFNHAGVEADYIYVGAYTTSGKNKSVSGSSPQVSQTRATFRSNAKAKGAGWSLWDVAVLSAIQMLMLVEFATNNMQSAIGRGYCDSNSSAISTGSCNSVANLTGRPAGTDGKVDVVWRGIEGLWGNVWEWVDGVNWNGGTYYVCNDPSKYADDTATNYTALSFKGATNWSSSYITEEGLDTGNNAHVMLPAAAGSGSESTYDCDACWSSATWRVFLHGGPWAAGSRCGLFAALLNNASSGSGAGVGSRLLYIPS